MRSKLFSLIGILSFLAIVVHTISYDKNTSTVKGVHVIENIPLNFKNWKGTDLKLKPIVYDILETRAIIHRTYRDDEGHEIFLSVVYYDETKVDFHAPEACLGGQGIKTKKSDSVFIISTEQGKQVSIKVNQLTQDQDDFKTLVYYFYKAGDFVGRNYIKLRLNLVLNKFRTSRKNGSLIRISAPITNTGSEKESHLLLKKFLTDIYPYIMEYL